MSDPKEAPYLRARGGGGGVSGGGGGGGGALGAAWQVQSGVECARGLGARAGEETGAASPPPEEAAETAGTAAEQTLWVSSGGHAVVAPI